MTATQPVEHVSFETPDEVREGTNWRMELVNLAGGAQVGRIFLQLEVTPGFLGEPAIFTEQV